MPRLVDRDLLAGPGCRVSAGDVVWRFSPSGGPGGQHANRANTRAEASLDLSAVGGIDDQVRERLVARLGPVLRVAVDRSRSQARNRRRALDEIEERLRAALQVDPERQPTRPGRRAVERRLATKRRRSERKADRGARWDLD